MRKDDIIGQKLFETCKLSEFYLNLIVNNQLSDPESPFELALAFKQKLYEIVERYDRLLEAASQREQLTLQLQQSNKPPQAPTSGRSTICRSAAVTPCNRVPKTNGGLISPLNVSTSSSVMNGLNYISQPATPMQHHQLHSASTTVSRSSSATNFSVRTYNKSKSSLANTPSRYKTSPSSSSCLSSGQSEAAAKLEQRIAAIYNDDFDDDDYFNDNDNYSGASSSPSSSKSESNHVETIELKPSNHRNLDPYDGSTNETTYDDDLDDMESSHSRQNIEKSFSNLSKDSGVLADSYHSDYSSANPQYMILSGVGCCLSSSQKNLSAENSPKLMLTSPLKSTDDSTSSNTDPDLSSEEGTSATLTSSPQPTTTNFALIRQSMAEKKLAQVQPDIYRTYTKTKHHHNHHHHHKKKSNSNLSLSSIASSSASTSASPSPGSSSSGISCNEPNSNPNPNPSLPVPINTQMIDQNNNSPPNSGSAATPPFFFNYNSLMNVSMLDSIQVTNNSLDFDNMSSSILMFN